MALRRPPTGSTRLSGRFRVRYASTTVNGAARERYLNQDRVIRADHADHHLVSLRSNRPLRVVDLRKEVNLDALHVDDGISTSNQPEVRSACSELADALRHWCPDLDGIVYRSRTTPTTSTNFAFFDSSAFEVASTRLGASADALDRLVDEGFTIDFTY